MDFNMKKVILAVFLFALVFGFLLNTNAEIVRTSPPGTTWDLSQNTATGKAFNVVEIENRISWSCHGVDGTCFSLSADKRVLTINNIHYTAEPITGWFSAEPVKDPEPPNPD